MASWREVVRPLRQIRTSQISRQSTPCCTRRWYSAEAAAEIPAFQDLEPESTQAAPGPTPEQIQEFTDPRKRAAERKYQLPSNRYQYHPPKLRRGPFHPVQSPPSSDPIARDFLPGPFYFPRLKETWQSTVAPDLMTLTYNHKPPGTQEEPIGQRLRSWDDSSPYHKNRPLRGPRGSTGVLRPVERDITFRNVPGLLAITLSTYMPQGVKEPTYLLAARAALQAVTGARTELVRVNKGVSQWGVVKGQPAGAKATVWGEQAYELMDKMVHLVFPKIKEWPGVEASTGDDTGNLAWGFDAEQFALFPEIQVNYDAYPAKVIPGCRVNVQTSAKSDRHARLLMQAMGVPFYGDFN
ncbi:putative 54S ribosomal protein L7, mitochondrial [Cytospora mali]|uniref:54S ribosomal protein L7, mitochondrial n=1 Tax=Cytospora mali TaxID=578113 RepID=A0A194W5D6_CYTMA|nr:putative 54S ribosomal protein L7, mitochondrial [Valsa mali]